MKILHKGLRASHLNFNKYKTLISKFDFPSIPTRAEDISYIYRYDGYLPKFIFNLMYKVPKTSKVTVFEKRNKGRVQIQTYIEDDFFKTVKYTEFLE